MSYLATNPGNPNGGKSYTTTSNLNGNLNQGVYLLTLYYPAFTNLYLLGGGGGSGAPGYSAPSNGTHAITISDAPITDFYNYGQLAGGGGGGGGGNWDGQPINGSDGDAGGGGGGGAAIYLNSYNLEGGNGGLWNSAGNISSGGAGGFGPGLSTSFGQICFGGNGASDIAYSNGPSTAVTSFSCNGNLGGGGGGGGLNYTTLSYRGAGGGGAGGGNGGNAAVNIFSYSNTYTYACAAGGGGSGGGKGGSQIQYVDNNGNNIQCGEAGDGGYGIYNNSTTAGNITNFYNSQGYHNDVTTNNLIIPLYFYGTLPQNYFVTISIDSSSYQFGQIYFPAGTTVPTTSTFTFNIDPSSNIILTSATQLKGVIVGLYLPSSSSLPSGTFTSNNVIYNWYLQEATYVNPNQPNNCLFGYDLFLSPSNYTGYSKNKDDLATILKPVILN